MNSKTFPQVLHETYTNYPVVPFIMAAIVAVVFVYAGFEKAVDPSGLVTELDAFHFPLYVSDLAGSFLPFLEISIGLGILLPFTRHAGSFLALGMLIIFTIYLSYIALTGGSTCACMGSTVTKIEYGLMRNMLLATLSVALYTGLSYKPKV